MKPGILRLLHLREQTEAAGEAMATERHRFARLADPTSAPRVVSAFNLFQTPEPLAERLAGYLLPAIGPNARILEPSAGLGRLYHAIRQADHAGPVCLVEQSADCCRELYGMTEGEGVTLRQGDFLGYSAEDLGGPFDGIIMNPPFKMWRDIKHINHARTMLAPGGRLVAICANGPRQREKLRPEADEWIDLEPGTFKGEGTKVNAAVCIFTASMLQ